MTHESRITDTRAERALLLLVSCDANQSGARWLCPWWPSSQGKGLLYIIQYSGTPNPTDLSSLTDDAGVLHSSSITGGDLWIIPRFYIVRATETNTPASKRAQNMGRERRKRVKISLRPSSALLLSQHIGLIPGFGQREVRPSSKRKIDFDFESRKWDQGRSLDFPPFMRLLLFYMRCFLKHCLNRPPLVRLPMTIMNHQEASWRNGSCWHPESHGKHHCLCLQDRWCCRASQKWRQESGSHPDCSAWLSQCTRPWKPWFPILYLPEISVAKSVRKELRTRKLRWDFKWSSVTDRFFLPSKSFNVLCGSISISTGNLKLTDSYTQTTFHLKALIPKSTQSITVVYTSCSLWEL